MSFSANQILTAADLNDFSTNSLGVGTTSPDADIEVETATGTTPTSPTEIRISTSTSGGSWSTTAPWGQLSFWSADTSNGGAKVQTAIATTPVESFGGLGRLGFWTHDGTSLNERMVVTNAGNVGIGTQSPAQTLQVVSDGGNLSAGNVSGETKGTLFLENSGGAKADGALSTGIAFSGTNTGRRRALIAAFQDGTDGDPHGLQFFTYGSTSSGSDAVTSRMTVKSDGNVGIGTTSPSYPLSFGAPSNNTQSIALYESGSAFYGLGNDVNRLSFYASNSAVDERVSIDSSGTLRIYDGNFNVLTGVIESDGTYANTTGSSANLHISSGGFFFRSTTSSAKYKTDVETMEDSYADAILGLRPVWYRSLCEHDPDSWGYWGFIAEEVAEIDSRLVTFGVPNDYEWQYDEDDQKLEPDVADLTEPEGVQYDRMVPHLVNLLARQRDQIADLSARVTTLEA